MIQDDQLLNQFRTLRHRVRTFHLTECFRFRPKMAAFFFPVGVPAKTDLLNPSFSDLQVEDVGQGGHRRRWKQDASPGTACQR